MKTNHFVCLYATLKSHQYLLLVIFMSCCSVLLSISAQASEHEQNQQQRLARHVLSLNELTERRRTNRLFANEQTPLHGQRIHYTNVGKGNTSFLMRDMVLINRLPTVFARVYDSSAGGGDFGVGWRISYKAALG